LYNRTRAAASSTSGNDQYNNLDSIELVACMEDCHNETEIAAVFKLTDLAVIQGLEQLGVEVDGCVPVACYGTQSQSNITGEKCYTFI